MFSLRVLRDCTQTVILRKSYGGALRRNINEIHTSLQRNISWIEVADPQIAIKIRCIKEEDIPHAMEMRRQVGIHDVSSSVRSWMKIDPEGIKVAENENGDIIGIMGLSRNHPDLYCGGFYCVHEKYRNLNIGSKLSFVIAQRALNKNIIGNSVLPMARKYIEQGYCNHIDENFTMLNNYIPNSVTPNVLTKNGLSKNIEIEPYQEYFLPSIVQYDATIAGFERRPILELNCKEKDSQTLVAFKDGTCIGYGSIKRSCFDAGRVGPLFADDPVVAEALLKKLLESFPDRKGFAMMTLRDNITANSFIRKLGNPEIITCVRIYSKEKIKVDTNRIFALTDMSFSAV